MTVEQIIGSRGIFLFYQKIAAITGMLMSLCVTAVAIFNNGHDDVAAVSENRFSIMVMMMSWTVIANRHYNNG